MKWYEGVIFTLIVVAILLPPVSLIIQLFSLPFSAQARVQVKRHPIAHFIWLVAGSFMIFIRSRLEPL